MAEEKVVSDVYTPTKKPHLRKGRGFSIEEIKKSRLTLHEVKRLGIPIDIRRKTIHFQNIQQLKENFGKIIPLTRIKGIGSVIEKELNITNILDSYDLAQADLNELSKRVKYSKKRLQKWQDEAKKILKEQ